MKIAIVNTNNTALSLVDHSNATDGLRADTEALFVDHPLYTPEIGLPVINTCLGVKTYYCNQSLRERLQKEIGFSSGKSRAVLFAVFNGVQFSDWMEISQNCRLMNGGVGPHTIWGNGIGLIVKGDIEQIVPGMSSVKQLLQDIGYKGEVYCEIAEDFKLTNLFFGHFYAHFAMFAELCRDSVDQIFDFIVGKQPTCELKDLMCISNLVSYPPFPLIIQNNAPSLNAPVEAKKHIWYFKVGGLVEVALITIVGIHLVEARRRMKITLRNMRKYNEEIQYRTDYGLHGEFVIMKDHYLALLEN